MNNKKIVATLLDGTKKEYDAVLSYKSETTGKDYMVYTANEYDNDNKLIIHAAIYNPDTMEFLGDVETKEEWDEIYRLLDKVLLN